MAEGKSGKISDFLNGIKAEFKKIVWPNKDDIVKQTIAVISSSIVLGIIISILDFIFKILLNFVIK
ncbi:preprotein translocase [Lachnospiraceae oral taxon 107 str. F0167]|jgi:preprotein translocase, secE subunit|uniref:preprotein translocase subunit SecE n=1 Tax=Lachnoanaerobaculum sp. Marseille-Q4761 TaxID=2819511 RepID=UPI000208306D|nr:preprotein translocase subunit SecE [Lachnoanaerobaculum sp. Marseille-Q4761]EGG92706.1 preprotein translocase [Lachnospiraceae oral taxon 107 str. F0167]MBO1871100.1 preprotein translocase subunit SecE [Lachnoanaerobaculum sp. Marseille-Q4761]RKW35756.1 MAG: preprotein translocase subunit SecE [Lachnospiraceae bacterium]